jgi:hypothetical protein
VRALPRCGAGWQKRTAGRDAVPGADAALRIEEAEDALEETLERALKSDHPDPRLQLSRAEIDDLIAYLGSLEH